MNINNFIQSKIDTKKLKNSGVKFLLTFFTLTILVAPYGQNKIFAQENSNSESSAKVTFNPPTGDKPKTTNGAATRITRQCINPSANTDLPPLPIIPPAQGLTTASHPTVLAYLPKISAKKVLFSWRDENNNEHYQTILSLENEAGIISLTLPEDSPPLELGKNYQWALAIMCDGKLHPDSPTIEGQIRRVSLESTINERLKIANPLETAVIYGQAGIWYETVAILAQLKTAELHCPKLASNWQDLLNSVGLEKVSQVPITSTQYE